jgi:hypothetical protein
MGQDIMGMLPVSVGRMEGRSEDCGPWGRTAIHGDTVRYADTSRNHDSVTHQLPCNLPTGYKGKRSEVTQRCSGGTDARSPWTAFAAVLGEVKQLAGKRNLIAHSGGLAHDVYIDADGQLYVEEAVSSAKKPPNKHVKKTASQKVAFHELLDHRQQAEALEEKLKASLTAVLFFLHNDQAEAIAATLAGRTKD